MPRSLFWAALVLVSAPKPSEPSCYIDDDQGCCATQGPPCKADVELCQPPMVPCYVRNARCSEEQTCVVSAEPAAPFDEARAKATSGAAQLRRRHSFTSPGFVIIQLVASAGWLYLGYKASRLLRFWATRRSTLLITMATVVLLCVCVLALSARLLLWSASASREGLTEPAAWVIIALSELSFSLLLSAALCVNLLWVLVCKGMLVVSRVHKALLVGVAILFPPLTMLLLWLGQEAVHEALTFLTYSSVTAALLRHANRLKRSLEASDDLNDLSARRSAVRATD